MLFEPLFRIQFKPPQGGFFVSEPMLNLLLTLKGGGLVYSRGCQVATTLTRCCFAVSGLGVVLVLVPWIASGFQAAAVDVGWLAVAAVCFSIGCWSSTSRQWQQLWSDPGPTPHRQRKRLVWWLLAGVLGLVVALKVGSADMDAYKKLVFGEGGLVEWGQVLVLVTAARVAWQIGADLRMRLTESWPSLVFRFGSGLIALLVLEELAWGQVIFGWQTPEPLKEINAQNETTLHNIGWFQDRLDLLYFLFTLLALGLVVLAPRLIRSLSRRGSSELQQLSHALSPAAYVWPLFLSVALLAFCVATRSFSEVIYNRDQEWGELVLYASGLLLLLRTRVLLGPSQSNLR